ncbi:chloramphenicol O-acetyltransferase type A [Prevotellaceae bacterium MN60]|nr:chloramphenicol O-acetyltransferase type A [Prevotellaceae bacterium MN60]
MKQEINPKDTNRAIAFELWTKSPMPMVTFTKTFDVTRLRKVSRKRGMKFNMLLCWCIGKAASGIPEFYMLPQDGKLYRYDHMAINVIVDNIKGGLSFCDVAVCDDLEAFNANYLHLTDTICHTCQDMLDPEAVIVGTSAVTGTELDSIVNQYSGIFNNPFVAWGRYHKGWFKTTLSLSFQFHHAQMDGSHAARFLEELQRVMNTI